MKWMYLTVNYGDTWKRALIVGVRICQESIESLIASKAKLV